METIQIIYSGELRTRSTHVRSGKTLITDAPTDNQGKGEAFSPTDLLASSLGTCMLTIMGIAASRHNFNIDGTRVKITKKMADSPRRVQEIIVDFEFPKHNYSEKEKEIMKKAAFNCPVAKSLHPDLKQSVLFNF